MYYRELSCCRVAWSCCCYIVRSLNTASKRVKIATHTPTPTTKKSMAKSNSKKMKSQQRIESALRDRFLQDKNESYIGHIYKKLYPWQTRLALAEHLKSTQVYNNDGLIALVKPYGMAQLRADIGGGGVDVPPGLSGGGAAFLPDNLPGVSDVLPDLCILYGEPYLEIVKSSERWSSGLMLLSTSSKITEKVRKCWRRARALQQAQYTYWAVTVGLPRPASGATMAAVTLQHINNVGKVPVLTKNYTSASLQRFEVKLSVAEHQTLIYNNSTDAALVQVNTQMLKHHFLRLWLSHCLSPVLGDGLFSSRVSSMAGRRVQVSPHQLTSYQSQVIPEALYSKLELPTRKVELIPCHVHLAKMHLIKFGEGKSDVIISAPPPEHFVWTCQQLGLMSDEGDQEGGNGVSTGTLQAEVKAP